MHEPRYEPGVVHVAHRMVKAQNLLPYLQLRLDVTLNPVGRADLQERLHHSRIRLIVTDACYGSRDSRSFDGIVFDPVRPGEYTSEKEEIYRLTGRINRELEAIIRRYPEQYLWMHDRWKKYKRRRKFLE